MIVLAAAVPWPLTPGNQQALAGRQLQFTMDLSSSCLATEPQDRWKPLNHPQLVEVCSAKRPKALAAEQRT